MRVLSSAKFVPSRRLRIGVEKSRFAASAEIEAFRKNADCKPAARMGLQFAKPFRAGFGANRFE
jgi:hypothetical protein